MPVSVVLVRLFRLGPGQQSHLRPIHLMLPDGCDVDVHPLGLQIDVLFPVVRDNAQRVEHQPGKGIVLLLIQLDAQRVLDVVCLLYTSDAADE